MTVLSLVTRTFVESAKWLSALQELCQVLAEKIGERNTRRDVSRRVVLLSMPQTALNAVALAIFEAEIFDSKLVMQSISPFFFQAQDEKVD
jgi:hypothetical protein